MNDDITIRNVVFEGGGDGYPHKSAEVPCEECISNFKKAIPSLRVCKVCGWMIGRYNITIKA